MKRIIALSIAFLMIFSFFVVFMGSTPSGNSEGPAALPMGTSSYHGSIVIAPNGSIITSVSGAPITHTGDSYTLTGNVVGTLLIERNSTNFNGGGFEIYNSSSSSNSAAVLGIIGSHNVVVDNLIVNASGTSIGSSIGALFYNTSNDNINGLNISGYAMGIMVLNETTDLNISNTSVAPSYSNGFLFSGIGIGFSFSIFFGGTNSPMNTTSNIVLYRDNITAFDHGAAIMSSSNDTKLEYSTIKAYNLTSDAVDLGGNGSEAVGNMFDVTNSLALQIKSPFNYSLSGLKVIGNTVNDKPNSTSAYSNPVISTNGTAVISKNSLKINMEGSTFVEGILFSGPSANVSENSINFYNGGSGSTSVGIAQNTSTAQITDNHITGSSSGSYLGVVSWFLSGNISNTYVVGNVIKLNASSGIGGILFQNGMNFNNSYIMNNYIQLNGSSSHGSEGILLVGTNDTVSGNHILLMNGSGDVGLFFEIGSMFSKLDNYTVLNHNSITLVNTSYSQAIFSTSISGSTIHNIQVDKNQISINSTGQYMGISIDHLNNTDLLGNLIKTSSSTESGPYLIIAKYSNNLTIASNTLVGVNSGNLAAIQFESVSHVGVENNSITNAPYGTSISTGNNITLDGNYYSNTSTDALDFLNADNVTVYHNDFMNYTSISSGGHNIRFNLSYPIGGNYWGTLAGHFTDKKSGPGQNQAGPDGINDSSYSPAPGVVDYYPLVHKWVRPQVVFYAPGGINGTTWKVTFNGLTKQSSNDTIAFTIVNGTFQNYSYHYYNSTLYYTNNLSGSISYNGSGLSVNVPYLHYSYIKGDVNITNFTVYVNGKQVTVDNGKFNLTVTEGSYDVKIVATGYATFNHTYNVTAGETLLVNPTMSKITHGSNPMLWEYIAAIVAVIAVAGGTILYLRGRGKT